MMLLQQLPIHLYEILQHSCKRKAFICLLDGCFMFFSFIYTYMLGGCLELARWLIYICYQIVIIKLRHHCVLLVAGALLLIGIVFFVTLFFHELGEISEGD